MLDDLDQIPWSTLEHAYGDAGDIPDIIRTLVSSDSNEREWAQDMLDMGPFHQGSIYSSTPFVVRFMMQLTQEQETYDKPWMLRYVSSVLASARYALDDPETPTEDPDIPIAQQVVAEVRSHLPTLLRLLEDPDPLMRLSVLRLLVLSRAGLPNLDGNLAEALKIEAQEANRGAQTFCLSLVADTRRLASILDMLDDITEPDIVRIAAGFGVIAALNDNIPDRVVGVFCDLIVDHHDALNAFEDIYADYLTPLGTPRGKDRLLECLHDGLSGDQLGPV